MVTSIWGQAHVGSGSKAEVNGLYFDVRFAPDSHIRGAKSP